MAEIKTLFPKHHYFEYTYKKNNKIISYKNKKEGYKSYTS